MAVICPFLSVPEKRERITVEVTPAACRENYALYDNRVKECSITSIAKNLHILSEQIKIKEDD